MDALKLSVLMLCTVIFLKTAEGLRCYTCASVDGSDPACEIPFNPTGSSVLKLDCDQAIGGTGEKHCAFTRTDGSTTGVRSFARTCLGNLGGLPANDCTSAGGATVCYCNDKDLCNDDNIFSNGRNAATNINIAITLVVAIVLINFVF